MALPSGYIELEYIQSSGTQYIDTKYKPNSNTRVICKTVWDVSAAAVWLFGGRVSSSSDGFTFLSVDNKYRSDFDASDSTQTIDASYGPEMLIDKNKNITYINDALVSTATFTTFSCPYNMVIFANNNSGQITGMSSARISGFIIYDNGTLVRDFVPCKNSSGEVGLYEQVSAQFYWNAGTGTFEAGPEIIPDYGVVALQDAQLTIGTSATITLGLVVTDPATGDPLNVTINSVSGTVNDTATTWTLSGGLWTATVPLSELGQYLCVFDVATSDGKTVEMRLPLYYGVMSLITDRTQTDVDELLSILQTPFADWTTEQAQLFYSGMSKGAYNASDLNRVGAAMVYIAERMASMGYAVDNITPKLYWMDTDTVTQSDMTAYLSDVSALQTVLPLPDETPTAPSDIAGLTYTEANNIEQILTIINTMLTNITLAYMYAGELYGGEV